MTTCEEIGFVFDKLISPIRMKTEFVGMISVDDDGKIIVMQYPTNFSKAMFSRSSTGSEHYKLDVERQAFILERINSTFNETGDYTKALVDGAMASIQFSLSRMVAPVAADNISNLIKKKDQILFNRISPLSKDNQLRGREIMKIIWHIYNGSQYIPVDNHKEATEKARNFEYTKISTTEDFVPTPSRISMPGIHYNNILVVQKYLPRVCRPEIKPSNLEEVML